MVNAKKNNTDNVIDINRKGRSKMTNSAPTKVKPIAATPTLYGKDAVNLIKDVLQKPSQSAIERNSFLLRTLDKVVMTSK